MSHRHDETSYSLTAVTAECLYLMTMTFPRTKWFAPECSKLLNWFANTRKYVAFCDANHIIFITGTQQPLVGFEPATSRSQVRHRATWPPRNYIVKTNLRHLDPSNFVECKNLWQLHLFYFKLQLRFLQFDQFFLSSHQRLLGRVLVNIWLQPVIHQLRVGVTVWLAAGSLPLAESSCDGTTAVSLHRLHSDSSDYAALTARWTYIVTVHTHSSQHYCYLAYALTVQCTVPVSDQLVTERR